jgi:hypothetical protein
VTLGTARHLSGEPNEGWKELAWQCRAERIDTWNEFEQPMWDGSSLCGRTILLWATPDFGLGDWIQFIRCARHLKSRGARQVIVECQRSLVSLLSRMPDVSRVVTRQSPPVRFDVHAPLILVPVLDHAMREPASDDVPYLLADPRDVECWQTRLRDFEGLTIGLCWRVRSSRPCARLRTIPLSVFEPLAAVRHVRFVSLQIGSYGAETFVVPGFVRRMLPESSSVAHTAALIESLDLVITVDTMIAHLAGALGKAVWTLLPYGADWRWGREDATPWYPSMRLFRQHRIDDWTDVIGRIGKELQVWTGASMARRK